MSDPSVITVQTSDQVQLHQSPDNIRETPKKRSKLGCQTCRKRKVRCDEKHPTCLACKRLNLQCSWRYLPPSSQIRNRPSSGSESIEGTPIPERGAAGDVTWNDRPFSYTPVNGYSGTPSKSIASSRTSPVQAHVQSAVDRTRQTVTITPQDQEPLQHFLTTMTKFCVLRNCVYDDLYGYILTNMGLFNQGLFNAMMAWSSLHLSHLRRNPLAEAEARFESAVELLTQELADAQDVDLVLTTIWFLLQYQLLLADGVDKFRQLLNCAADVTKGELDRYDVEPSMSRIGPIGCIVLVWMSARDSQAAYFGGTGRLLGYLKMYPCIYELIDRSSVVEDLSSASSLGEKESQLMRACMRLSLRNKIVNGQIVLLGRWRSDPADSLSWISVLASLVILRKEVEEDNSVAAVEALAVARGSLIAMPTVSALGYNRLLLLASYYAGLISYHQHNPGTVPNSSRDAILEPEECAARIIRITQRVTRDRPNSPRAIWPTILFKAATTIKDPVYQSWAVRMFLDQERWGENLAKTRVLLENIIDRQNRSGMEVDFVKVMEETTGYFIV